jgi:asparagine synthase (glutamine-hydrolysing)
VCGIAGQVRSDGAPVDPALIERMCAAQEHRGPDSRGVFASGEAALGIQRLRIIDLTTGDQPIFNEDRSLAVVLNGEIYNFLELRAQLEQRGHRFYTGSDTEVIVHLYEERGPECVRSLHGMFGFALWDAPRRRLLVARDRVGKKPLFYCERPGALSFASELGALLQDPEIPRDLDHEAIDSYLALDYVPSPLTAFRAVRKLPPGSLLVWTDGAVRVERYWRLDYSRKRADASPAQLEEEIREAIRKAVRRRMIADVPLGAFLSGGIDSSAVVAAMAEASPQAVKTFSIGFDHESHNELPYARRIADEFATEHHELVVSPNAVEILPQIVRHYGEPFGDSSAIPSFYLAELARRHVTVALNGDGGDESFAGYQRYTSNMLLERLDVLPFGVRRLVTALAARLPSNGDPRCRASKLKRFAGGLSRSPEGRYIAQISSFTGREREQLYTDEYRAFLGESDPSDVILGPWIASSATNLLDRLLDVDVTTYLPGDLLTKIDIATMAHSLEARSPLLDHELMELAAALPADMKARGQERKVGLKSALRGWVPDAILDAPKRGFEVPLAAWLRGELRELAYDVLLDRTATSRRQFKPDRVRTLLDEHAGGSADHSARIWSLLVLELWQRQIAAEQPLPIARSVA